jgi:hypothetical protein
MAAVSDIHILNVEPLLSPVGVLRPQTILSAPVGITDAPANDGANIAATEILLKYAHDSLA